MRPTTQPATGQSFVRRRSVSIGAALTTVGILAGASMLAASPAAAATAADCTPANTVDGATQTGADIQTLLTAHAPVICLVGTIPVSTTLTFTQPVSLFGLSNAILDGTGTTAGILRTSTATADLMVQGIRFTHGQSSSTGGAISGYTVTVADSTFDDNRSDFVGGAVYGRESVVAIRSVFTANSGSNGGGAIGGGSGFIDIAGSTFTGNTSDYVGGAVAGYGVMTVEASTFDDNEAVFSGGAVIGSDVIVTNSTFLDNSLTEAGGDGAAISTYGDSSVQFSTFLNNTSPDPTGGQSIWAGGVTLTLRGNIFAADAPATQVAIDAATGVDAGGNLFTTPVETENYFAPFATASTRFDLDRTALLGAGVLGANGGPTATIALPAGSPAIGAVPEGTTPPADQRGVARPAVSDAGAFQAVASVAPAATLPAAGLESAPVGLLAAVLVALGAATVAVRRRFAG